MPLRFTKTEIEKQPDKKIKIIKSNRDGEYYGKYTKRGQSMGPFGKFLEEEDIIA